MVELQDEKRSQELGNLSDMDLQKIHDRLHGEWNKILRGEESRTVLYEVFKQHHAVIAAMQRNGVPHITPIDQLDIIKSKLIK